MFRLLLLFFIIGAARSELPSITPCKPNDSTCFLKNGKAIFPKLISGDSITNTENLDPMKLKEIEAKLATLYYKLTDVTFIGLKDCDIDNVKLNPDKPNLSYDIICPHLSISGNYETNGQLLTLPVEGQGPFTIDAKEYHISIDCGLKKVTGGDGKDHYSIKDFKLELDPRGSIDFDFKNLFNGNKELSDKVHKFVKDNSREVSKVSHEPLLKAVVKKIIKNSNKYMDLIPIEKYLILN